MTNLKNKMNELLSRVKALFMKILPHLIIIVLVGSISWFIINRSIHQAEDEAIKYEQYKKEQDDRLKKYQQALDSLQTANFVLERDLMELEGKLDSITKKQHVINEVYQEDLDVINHATLPEHAIWFYSKLDSIRQYYRQNR